MLYIVSLRYVTTTIQRIAEQINDAFTSPHQPTAGLKNVD